MIIAIEGMDGVGKTTCAESIAQKLNYPCISHPIKNFFKNGIDNSELHNSLSLVYKMDPTIRAWFMGLGNLYACNGNKNAVLDRHLASNFFWNGNDDTKPVFDALVRIIGKPDLTILLYATAETRKTRISSRNLFDRDLSDSEKWVDGYTKMENFLKDFSIPYVKIMTDGKKTNTVCQEVLSHIQKKQLVSAKLPANLFSLSQKEYE